MKQLIDRCGRSGMLVFRFLGRYNPGLQVKVLIFIGTISIIIIQPVLSHITLSSPLSCVGDHGRRRISPSLAIALSSSSPSSTPMKMSPTGRSTVLSFIHHSNKEAGSTVTSNSQNKKIEYSNMLTRHFRVAGDSGAGVTSRKLLIYHPSSLPSSSAPLSLHLLSSVSDDNDNNNNDHNSNNSSTIGRKDRIAQKVSTKKAVKPTKPIKKPLIPVSAPTPGTKGKIKRSKRKTKHQNLKAQEIFTLIENRYGINIKTQEWSKARRYIYHATATASSAPSLTVPDTSTDTSTDDKNNNNNSGAVEVGAENDRNNIQPRRKRRRGVSLNVEQTETVLNYLEREFQCERDQMNSNCIDNNNRDGASNNNSSIESNIAVVGGDDDHTDYYFKEEPIVPFILRHIPRILKRNVDTQLRPTVEFLNGLYSYSASNRMTINSKSEMNNAINTNVNMFHTAIQRNPNLLLTSGINSSGRKRTVLKRSNMKNVMNDKSSTNSNMNNNNKVYENIESHLLQHNLGLSKRSLHKLKKIITHSPSYDISEKQCAILIERMDSIILYLLSLVLCNDDNDYSNHTIVNAVNSDQQNNTMNNFVQLQQAKQDEMTRRKIIGKIISTNPQIFTLNLDSNIKPKVLYLQSVAGDTNSDLNNDIDESKEFLTNVFKKFPSVLGLSLDKNLIPTLDLIRSIISYTTKTAIQDNDLGKGEEDNLDRQNEEHQKLLRKILMQHPQVLGLSIENIQKKVKYFNDIDHLQYGSNYSDDKSENNDGLRQLSLAAKIMTSSPSVYSLSLKENIVPTVECLAKLWGVAAPLYTTANNADLTVATGTTKPERPARRSLQKNNLAQKIGEYPVILTQSLEGNILPTINFYNRTGHISLDSRGCSRKNGEKSFYSADNKATKERNDGESSAYLPARYLAASLFNRLLPRWNYYVVEEAKRINKLEIIQKKKDTLEVTERKENDRGRVASVDDKKMLLNQSLAPPPLHLIASASDGHFCRQMNYDLDSYIKFKDEAVPRLKFSSQFDTWLKTGRPIDM